MTVTDDTATISRPNIAPRQLFIDGHWRESFGGGRTDIIDPSTGTVLTSVADGVPRDIDEAVAAARAAFDDGRWSGLPSRERARILYKVGDIIRDRADELVATESADVGKPVSICRAADVIIIAEQYEYCAAIAQTLGGSNRETPLNAHAYTSREPLGVVGAITPFNFPLILSSSKIAPALAAGNTVVHKPAEDTPLSALLMSEILTEAGVPPGVLNVVTGKGSTIGEALLQHRDVNKIAFTGSTDIGRHAASVAGQHLIPITLELG
ncbi:MAG TPA: aldehyde dehydrogenase family protein, partial [Mycobacterium sp.]|nr:aldehyde dehydrogenase family protein [Mycobacterium sp.]